MQDQTAKMPSAAVSRRQFLGTAGATGVGLGLGSGLLTSAVAAADSGGSAVLPRPIPSGFVTPVGVFIQEFALMTNIAETAAATVSGMVQKNSIRRDKRRSP